MTKRDCWSQSRVGEQESDVYRNPRVSCAFEPTLAIIHLNLAVRTINFWQNQPIPKYGS